MTDPIDDYRAFLVRQHEFRRFVRGRLAWYGIAVLTIAAFAWFAT